TAVRVHEPVFPTLASQMGVREKRPDVRVLAKLNCGIDSLIGGAGRNGKQRIDERAVSHFLLRRLLGKDHADACPVAGGRAVRSVMDLESERCAGLDAKR